MTSSTERKPSEWDTGTMCKDRRFYRHLWNRNAMQEIKKCMNFRGALFLRSLKCYFGIYFTRRFTTWEINTKITFAWALKQFVTRVHTVFYIHIVSNLYAWQRSSVTLLINYCLDKGAVVMVLRQHYLHMESLTLNTTLRIYRNRLCLLYRSA